MEYNVIVSNDAHKDIDETINYILNNLKNSIAAKDLLLKIEKTYNQLSNNPYMFALCNDVRLQKEGYRKAVIKNYILIYRIDEKHKKVFVLRMFFGRRNYAELI